ncbi:MAG: ferrous iron transport protein A [Lysobacterales bacterium]
MNFPNTPEVTAHPLTLASLKRGEKGVVLEVDTRDPLTQRLMTLGLVEGAEVERGHAAIGGDPIEYRVFGLGISLRAEQAKCFAISAPLSE